MPAKGAKGPSAGKAPVAFAVPEALPPPADDIAPALEHTVKCWDARESPLTWSLVIRKWLRGHADATISADVVQQREQKLCEMLYAQCSIGRAPSPLMM